MASADSADAPFARLLADASSGAPYWSIIALAACLAASGHVLTISSAASQPACLDWSMSQLLLS